MLKVNEKGAIPVLFLVVALGALAFLVIASSADFKNKLFSRLYQKPPSQASETSQLNDLTKQLLDAVNSNRPMGSNIKQIAQTRKDLLLSELEKDTFSFISKARLVNRRNDFPEDLKPFIEQNIEQQEGEISVLHLDNFQEKKSKTEYYLDGLNTKLYFTLPTTSLKTGDKVKVSGIKLDRKIAVDTTKKAKLTISQRAKRNIVTNVNLAIIMFKFKDAPEPYFTPQSIENKMFKSATSLVRFYQDNSFKQMSLKGNVFGWYTLPINKPTQGCDSPEWYQMADEQVNKAGGRLNNYTHKMYVWADGVEGCSFGGLAQLDGTWSVINYSDSQSLYAHELGHNLGNAHASKLNCQGKQIGDSDECLQEEYGDYYDVMGLGYNPFNIPHKLSTNWLNKSQIQIVTQTGIYKISGLEDTKAKNKIKGLKIYRPDMDDYYYIEYRRPLGFSSTLDPKITNGALIHTWNEDKLTNSYLIDATPETPGTVWITDESLLNGASFIDPFNDLTIKQISHTPLELRLEIKFGPNQYFGPSIPKLLYYASVCTQQDPKTLEEVTAEKPQILLGWARSKNALGYEVFKDGQNIATLYDSDFAEGFLNVFYLDEDLEKGKSYVYKIRAFDSSQRYSRFSGSKTIRVNCGLDPSPIDPTKPPIPTIEPSNIPTPKPTPSPKTNLSPF